VTQAAVAGLGTGAIYAVFAVGLVLVYRTTRVLNFAQAEVGTFATFVTWWLITEASLPWAAAAAAGIASAVVLSLVVERAVLRKLVDADRTTVVIATVAIALGLGAAELKIWGASPAFLPAPLAGRGLTIADVTLPPTRLLALGLAVLLSAGLWLLFRYTTLGLSLLAVAQNPTAVRLAGIRLSRLSALTWGLSAVLGATASLLIAPTLGAFSAFYLARLMLFAFAAAVLGGGMVSLPGAVLGGLGLGVWEAVIGREFPSTAGIVDVSVFLLLAAALLDRSRNPFTRAVPA
jgi:branched-chain amino acid transport system permease protein